MHCKAAGFLLHGGIGLKHNMAIDAWPHGHALVRPNASKKSQHLDAENQHGHRSREAATMAILPPSIQMLASLLAFCQTGAWP